ncbi:EthD domain-containing protein [Novosphingobium sp. SG707]|uniref:EthD domain-containing protein n=1 Tax=Novosphingobium sp. SG707 TaxID=2586996 RepID=UPI00144567E8|nr:EthD domain-containing protein [Novosphingobium sp. SG707]NKJ02351.1 hypothetical protein [Novosphingobium sp. SG707]
MPIKLAIIPQNRSGMSHAQLREYLERHHGPLCLAHPDVSGPFQRYIHHYVDETFPLPDGYTPLERGAVTLISFADMAGLVASKQSTAYIEVVGPDEDNFRDEAGSQALMVDENVIIDGIEAETHKAFVLREVAGDPKAFAAEHAARLHDVIKTGAIPKPDRLVINSAASDKVTCDFNQFDEISFANREDLRAFLGAIAAANDSSGGKPVENLIVCNTVIFK